MTSSKAYKFGLLKSIDLAQIIAPSAKIFLDDFIRENTLLDEKEN